MWLITLGSNRMVAAFLPASVDLSYVWGIYSISQQRVCFRTTSLYLPMPHLSLKLIWTCSLCGEDIHPLISCLCVAGINIICWFAFCNHIVWFSPSFHRLGKIIYGGAVGGMRMFQGGRFKKRKELGKLH